MFSRLYRYPVSSRAYLFLLMTFFFGGGAVHDGESGSLVYDIDIFYSAWLRDGYTASFVPCRFLAYRKELEMMDSG